MDDLKPCPFCGGKAFVDVFMDREYVACEHEKNCLFEIKEGDSLRKEVNAWNRRAKDGEQDEQVD